MTGRKSKNIRKTRPVYFVFCEGQTENAYINVLKSHFKFPIEIRSKVLGNGITAAKIRRSINEVVDWEKDKVFLLYDSDVEAINEKLKQISFAEPIFSYPCFEAWLLLHFQETLNTDSCHDIVSQIKFHHPAYKKGEISFTLGRLLMEKLDMACSNAVKLINVKKGSYLFRLIDSLKTGSFN